MLKKGIVSTLDLKTGASSLRLKVCGSRSGVCTCYFSIFFDILSTILFLWRRVCSGSSEVYSTYCWWKFSSVVLWALCCHGEDVTPSGISVSSN